MAYLSFQLSIYAIPYLDLLFLLFFSYGYNGRGIKNGNLLVVHSGEIVYAVGHAVVLLDCVESGSSKQRHYRQHTGLVTR